ncbi:Smr/MutS family protein [Salinisphaera sp.]|uniref:Smr/MutS family protein n=1 Tax=Salinisphaera sp. TaxID=1914330 RepID=UPI000C58C75D|nr:Smr/MutS family protein [Salinisphaera sp.]MBS63056.1 DNA mismatch repair protein MutS [Salinisphaera sp.]
MADRSRSQNRARTNRDSQISDDDSALFRDAVGPVTEVAKGQRRRPWRHMPSARPAMREADEQAVIGELLDFSPGDDIETGDDLFHRREGVQLSVMRKLRRGQYRCQAEIDLHGMIVDVARHCLAVFLREALDRDYRCVRVVHGKGLRSGNRGPVLKVKVAHWLRQRDEVLAYCSARENDGGTGAVYVLLRRG